MAKSTDRFKTKKRADWSDLSGDKPMTSTDRLFFYVMIGVVAVLFMVIYASRPPFQIS